MMHMGVRKKAFQQIETKKTTIKKRVKIGKRKREQEIDRSKCGIHETVTPFQLEALQDGARE
jgi:hypothetical protein